MDLALHLRLVTITICLHWPFIELPRQFPVKSQNQIRVNFCSRIRQIFCVFQWTIYKQGHKSEWNSSWDTITLLKSSTPEDHGVIKKWIRLLLRKETSLSCELKVFLYETHQSKLLSRTSDTLASCCTCCAFQRCNALFGFASAERTGVKGPSWPGLWRPCKVHAQRGPAWPCPESTPCIPWWRLAEPKYYQPHTPPFKRILDRVPLQRFQANPSPWKPKASFDQSVSCGVGQSRSRLRPAIPGCGDGVSQLMWEEIGAHKFGHVFMADEKKCHRPILSRCFSFFTKRVLFCV